MIDWNKSAKLNGVSVDELNARFALYPQSNKQVVAICDECGKVRNPNYKDYTDLCHACSCATPEYRDNNSKRMIQYNIDNPESGNNHSKKMIQYYIDHPEARESARLKTIEQFSSSETRNNHSDTMVLYYDDHPEQGRSHSEQMIEHYKDSEVRKAMSELAIQWHKDNPELIEKMSGGYDIIMHHYLYDDADLSKYTMPMTRSDHTAMHNRMRSDGYEVKHINSATDDNGLWGYN